MRRRGRVPPVAAGISALLMIAAHGASLEDGKAAFERREDTMKHMGRPLFLGIGRVVKGTAAYGPDTVTAETLPRSPALSTGACFFRGRMWQRARSNRRFSAPAIMSIS